MAEVTVDIVGMRVVKCGPLLSAKQGTETSEAPQRQVHHDGQLGAHEQGQRAGPLQQPPQHPGLRSVRREESSGQAGAAQQQRASWKRENTQRSWSREGAHGCAVLMGEETGCCHQQPHHLSQPRSHPPPALLPAPALLSVLTLRSVAEESLENLASSSEEETHLGSSCLLPDHGGPGGPGGAEM